MNTTYRIEIDGKIIGETLLEKADAPMGVLIGKIHFHGITSGYQFFKEFATANSIELNLDDPEFSAIETQTIPELKVIRQDGKEIHGQGNYVGGMDSDYFEITILGYPYPDFENDFPEHSNAYWNKK